MATPAMKAAMAVITVVTIPVISAAGPGGGRDECDGADADSGCDDGLAKHDVSPCRIRPPTSSLPARGCGPERIGAILARET